MPFRFPRLRAAAVLAVPLALVSAGSVAPPAQASPRDGRAVNPDVPDSLEEPVAWAARRALVLLGEKPRPRRARPRMPIRGALDFGESAARYGAQRSGHVHEGQDVFAPAGTPLVAVRDSVVVETGDDGGRGNYIALYSPAADETYVYLHMQAPAALGGGRRVRAGRTVGAVGCTGSCWGDHLHFEIRRGRGANGESVNPLPHLLRWAKRSRRSG